VKLIGSRHVWAVAAIAGIVAGGCASSHPVASGDGTSGANGGGWIGSAPDFRRAPESGGSGVVKSGAADRAALPASAATTAAGGAFDTSRAQGQVSDLKAGNIDDNADFAGFLSYLQRIGQEGVPFRPLDPSGRIVVTVTDANQHAASGVEVTVKQGDAEIARLRTTADGTVRFQPHAYGAAEGTFTFSAGSSQATATAGGTATLVADAPPTTDRVPLDLLFLIDATGSMGDEIARLKTTVATVVDRIEALPGQPDVRIGMTLFRDQGDAFVTATYDFTADIGAFQTALAAVQADGGGDTPEALDEGLDEALAKPSWRPAGTATQLVVLIGDAGGHPDRQLARPYTKSMVDAAARGVKILPIAASSSDDQAEVAFRQLAQFTGGRFVFLSYGAEGAALGTSTDISKADYEELSLDDLVVRLVADELSARTGQPITVPPAPSTTSTNPPGQ
jgi:Mg-chelatase subunit ChlD